MSSKLDLARVELGNIPGIPEHIRLYFSIDGRERVIEVPIKDIQMMAWEKLPPVLRDSESPEARAPEGTAVRMILKTFIKQGAPYVLRKMFPGDKIEIPKKVDAIQWALKFILSGITGLMASTPWRLQLYESSQEDNITCYKVVGFVTDTENKAGAATTTNA